MSDKTLTNNDARALAALAGPETPAPPKVPRGPITILMETAAGMATNLGIVLRGFLKWSAIACGLAIGYNIMVIAHDYVETQKTMAHIASERHEMYKMQFISQNKKLLDTMQAEDQATVITQDPKTPAATTVKPASGASAPKP
jgi:hypothetical protein